MVKLSREIVISTSDLEVEATLLEERAPETCDEIWEALPLEGEARNYKEEVYFEIPVEIDPEEMTPEVKRGDISYWPRGPAFCVFYGDSQPVSPVSTFARLKEGTEDFREIDDGDRIEVHRSE